MIKAKRLLLILLITMGGLQMASAQNYDISGSVTGFKNNSKVYLSDIESDTQINSTLLKQGKFHLQGKLKDGRKYINLIISQPDEQYQCTIFAGAGKVAIKGDKKDFPYDLNITGNAEQAKFNKYFQSQKILNHEAASFYKAYTQAQGDSIKARKAALAFNAIGDKLRTAEKEWIFANLDTYYAANQLYDYLPKLNRDTIQQIYKFLPAPVKQSIYGRRINTYLIVGDTLKVNDRFTDFQAFDPAGKSHKLSEVTGKYILLDFSTIHCGPCNQSVDEIRSVSAKYKGKLSIISFSVDKRADWLQGINDDKTTWLTLSDGKGSYSKVILKYAVQAYPTFYLISPDGIVVDKWLGYEKTEDGGIEKHLSKLSK